MENTEKTPQERLDQFIHDNKIELKTQFVPFSFSRDAGKVDIAEEKDKLFRAVGLTLNWNVTLSGNKKSITTEYSKGIGHLDYDWLNPYYKIKTVDQANQANTLLFDAVEKGISYNTKSVAQFEGRGLKIKSNDFPTPTVAEILHGMVLDASSLEHPTFESWADEMGGNPDSRAEEKIYNKCKEISYQFLKVVGGTEKLQELREILSDVENEPTPRKNKP
jgi:hypothetical protein